jgi:hypothetical protein
MKHPWLAEDRALVMWRKLTMDFLRNRKPHLLNASIALGFVSEIFTMVA